MCEQKRPIRCTRFRAGSSVVQYRVKRASMNTAVYDVDTITFGSQYNKNVINIR